MNLFTNAASDEEKLQIIKRYHWLPDEREIYVLHCHLNASINTDTEFHARRITLQWERICSSLTRQPTIWRRVPIRSNTSPLWHHGPRFPHYTGQHQHSHISRWPYGFCMCTPMVQDQTHTSRTHPTLYWPQTSQIPEPAPILSHRKGTWHNISTPTYRLECP